MRSSASVWNCVKRFVAPQNTVALRQDNTGACAATRGVDMRKGTEKSKFPRPGAHSAKNVRQAGAPNHLKGSGENPMVGTIPTIERRTRDAVDTRIASQSFRFVGVTDAGRLFVDFAALTDLVSEIVTEHVSDRTAELRAECAALSDQVEDLAWDLNTARETTARAGGER